jgi:formylglycine-generating enzyme required for sulfatase activity
LRHVLALFAALFASWTCVHDDENTPPKLFTNDVGMVFVWIPPGTFTMGCSRHELGHRPLFEAQHKVTLTKGFYMGKHLVTQEQWIKIMGKNPSTFTGEKGLPVDGVSWNDCQDFIKRLRRVDKRSYRLPTEAEWEYSCRAGTTTPFCSGNTITTDQANYDGNGIYEPLSLRGQGLGKKGEFRKKTTPVGRFPPNAWGLHDMHGNLCQWCQDWFGEYSPKDAVDPLGPKKGEERTLRGGCWRDDPIFLRSAFRLACEPGSGKSENFGTGLTGFRVCFFPQ